MRNVTFSLMTILFILWGLIGSAYCEPSLKVGALVPFAGRWADSGRECAKGMLDAGKWINQKGGIFGRKLEVLLIEDTFQIAETIAAYRKWTESDHILLLYLYATETALTLHPHIQLSRLPTLVSFLPSEMSNPSTAPFYFTATPTILDSAKIAEKFISENSGVKARKPRMVFVGSPTPVDHSFLDEAKAYARGLGIDVGPDVSISDLFHPGDTGQGERLRKSLWPSLSLMTSYEPDFAYLSLSSRESSVVLQEAGNMGLKTRWVGNRRAFDETLSPFEGVFGVQPVAPYGEDVPGMTGIREAHQRWHPFDSHTLSYVEGWATLRVMAEVLGRSLPEHRLSPERVRSSLESLGDFVSEGLLPPITISSNDHRPSVESRVFVVKGGKLTRHTGFISLGR